MPVEVRHSPPLHRPGDVTARPKSILKNPSFSGPSGQQSPDKDDPNCLPTTPLDPQEAKEITLQNTLQNAGHRRSSSAARRQSATRRRSSNTSKSGDEDPDKMRLKWDEANLYLAEQQSGGRMKITEPKTPFQYGDPMNEVDNDGEDVGIDPRYVNVDEVDMAKNKPQKKSRESDIPGLDIGEAEDDGAGAGAGVENDRIVRGASLSRESSKDKHVSVSSDTAEGTQDQVGMPTREEQEKHRQFEEQRKKHYEMRNVKDILGHSEDIDDMDEDEPLSPGTNAPTSLPNRGVNGA